MQCSKRNKSLRATGGVTEQFLSGLISTNTAPATSTCTIYQDLELVEYLIYHVATDAFEVKTVERHDPEFLAVVCSVGALGLADRDRVLACCRTYFKQHGWPNIPVEIELTKTDPFYLSPWNWKGLEYIVKFNFMFLTNNLEDPEGSCGGDDNVYRAGIKTYLKGLWDALIAAGIPFKAHWGKSNIMDQAFVKATMSTPSSSHTFKRLPQRTLRCVAAARMAYDYRKRSRMSTARWPERVRNAGSAQPSAGDG